MRPLASQWVGNLPLPYRPCGGFAGSSTLANVVELIASEIVQGARRLSAVQAKRYTVSYEVVVPSTMSVDALIEKANRIASAGSVESQTFRQVLTATDGVEQVSQVVIKIPARVGQIEEIMDVGGQ